jgi:AcrR family transcriptional regulator
MWKIDSKIYSGKIMLSLVKREGRFHHGNLEAALIDGAISMICERGGMNFSLREVSQQIGVSHAAAYRHFKSKGELIAQIAIKGYSDLYKLLDEVTNRQENRVNSYRLLLELSNAYIDFGFQNPNIYRALFVKDECDEINAQLIKDAANDCFAIFTDAVKSGQDAFKISHTQNANEIATMIWASLHGYLLMSFEMDIANPLPNPNAPFVPKQRFIEMIHNSIWR